MLYFTQPMSEFGTGLQGMVRQLGLDPVDLGQENIGIEGVLCFRKPSRRVSESPGVSITIPAYSPRFFEQALASALAQTYPNIEIIVSDDSEKDEIERITRRLGGTRPVRYERNTRRQNARGNYAKCFALAQGEFIKYLNDDDVLLPDCVERMVEAFRSVPDCTLVTSYRPRINEAGAFIQDQPATRPIAKEDMAISGASLANVMIMAGLNIVGEPTTTMFRRADLQRAIPEDFQFSSDRNIGILDMAMWLPLLLKGDAVYLADGLSHFRIHASQQQQEPWIQKPTIENIRALQSKWLDMGAHAYLRRDMFLAKPLADVSLPWRNHPLNAVFQLPPGWLWRFS